MGETLPSKRIQIIHQLFNIHLISRKADCEKFHGMSIVHPMPVELYRDCRLVLPVTRVISLLQCNLEVHNPKMSSILPLKKGQSSK